MAEQARKEDGGRGNRRRESVVKRNEVLSRYEGIKFATQQQRVLLEQAKLLHVFRRDAEVLETWINEKVQIASDEAYKDRRNLQVAYNFLCMCYYMWVLHTGENTEASSLWSWTSCS